MSPSAQRAITRRELLRYSAGALLGTTLWPGCARYKHLRPGGSFRFAVLNDCHLLTANCGPWFEQVRSSLLSLRPKPEFCLLVGDLAEKGTSEELGAMREVLDSFRMPFFAVPGNHDLSEKPGPSMYDQLFPNRRNYSFEHSGWRFVGLDSTEGTKWQNTSIQPATLSWAGELRKKLRPADPTVVFTHFPLGTGVSMRPFNAEELLEPFKDTNLVAVFNGHFHGFTQRRYEQAQVTTNRCCAISRDNHDGSQEKGFFVCDASEGSIHRQFFEIPALEPKQL